MENRKPNKSQTQPQQGERQEAVPRGPHERDESADSQAPGEPSQGAMADIARQDVERGASDTDKGPVLRELHEKKI